MISLNDDPEVLIEIPPTQSPILGKFLELLNERWVVKSSSVKGRRGVKTSYFVNTRLSELVAFHDQDLVKGEFKSKVFIDIEGDKLYYSEFKKVVDGFSSEQNEKYIDLKATKSYDILSHYITGVDIPDWVDPNITRTQTYQYPSIAFTHPSESDFLAFNIRSGGGSHDSIKELAIVQVSNGNIESSKFFEIDNDLDRVWASVQPFFERDQIVVAYNLSVHKSNLEKSLNKIGLRMPQKDYVCVYNMAKSALREVEKPTMENVCYAFSIPFIDHCKDKANAAAEISLKIEQLTGKSLNDYNKYLITNRLRYGS